jgi:hypothetical protein
LLICAWVALSGIGGLARQHGDFLVRNPILYDLVNKPLPLFYNLSTQSLNVQQAVGHDVVSFTYYLTYWLPAAVTGKLFGMYAANVCLTIWSILGLILFFYQICRTTAANPVLVIILFILWGQLDIAWLSETDHLAPFFHSAHIGNHQGFWESTFLYPFFYRWNTNQLFTVFNQCIPVWLITSLCISERKAGNIAFIAALSFCYAPYATIGIIPITIYLLYNKSVQNTHNYKVSIRQISTPQNIIIPLMLFIVFGMYYAAKDDATAQSGFVWSDIHNVTDFLTLLLWYVILIVSGLLLYIVFLWKMTKKSGLLLVAFITLLILPIYKSQPDNNFLMRCSIPALCVVAIFFIQRFHQATYRTKIIVAMFFTIYSITPILEMASNLKATITCIQQGKSCTTVQTLTFDQLTTSSDLYLAKLVNRQFFVHHYNDKLFYKTIGNTYEK